MKQEKPLAPDRAPPAKPSAVVVRSATPRDAESVAELLGVLGYPATAAEVVGRLERLAGFESAVVFVAEADGRVVGLVTGHAFPAIHANEAYALLTTLVVSERHQHRGIGAVLTSQIEDWARTRGAVRVSLTSGLQRKEAHAFYEHLGYERTGLRLTKALNRP